jgi:hypothetical protein
MAKKVVTTSEMSHSPGQPKIFVLYLGSYKIGIQSKQIADPQKTAWIFARRSKPCGSVTLIAARLGTVRTPLHLDPAHYDFEAPSPGVKILNRLQ